MSYVWPESIVPEGDPGETTTGIPDHEEAYRVLNLGPTFIDARREGAVGNGVDDDSAAITDVLARSPSNGIVRVPSGEYMVDAPTLELLASRNIMGDGAETTWFTLIDDSAGDVGALYINVPSPVGSVRGVYGPRIKGIGINLENAPSATGVRVGEHGGGGTTSGWTWLDDIRIEGGAWSWDNQAANVKMTNFHLLNPSAGFFHATDTGLEVELAGGIMEVGPGLTVPVLAEIALATGGQKGAFYISQVRVNVDPTATVNRGFYEHCPNGSTASAPIRATNVTGDNLAGPAWDLVNVSDCQIMGGWSNCAAGVGNGAIRFYGGGGHTVVGQQQMNGGSGSACSFDFAGGGTAGVTLGLNNPATGPYYRITGTPPTDLRILDRIWNVAVAANITNDWPALRAALAKDWTASPIVQEDVHVVGSGGGNPAFVNSWAAAGSEIVYFWKDTLGVVHLAGPMTGGSTGTTAFTLPAGYRPVGTETFVAGAVTISAAGVVTLNGSTVSVSGITFRQAN